MKNLLPVLAMLAGLGSLISSAQGKSFRSPLDLHIETLRSHGIDPSTIRFATACGVDIKGTSPRFGFANNELGTWHVVSDLPKSYNKYEADVISTAEVWKIDDRTVVEEWKAVLDLASISLLFRRGQETPDA
jgi:hypothetical protein